MRLHKAGLWDSRIKLRKEFSLFGAFLSVGLVGQVSSFIIGILIIRALGKPEYGYYVLYFSLLATLLQFSDLGISSGTLSEAGKCHQDRARLGAVIATARKMRTYLIVISGLPVVVWGLWLIHFQNEAPVFLTAALLFLLLPLSYLSMETSIYQVVPKIAGAHRFLFGMGIGLSLFRLLLGLVLFLYLLNLATALGLFVTMSLIEYVLYRRASGKFIDPQKRIDPEVFARIRKVVSRQGLNTGFFILFSQLSIWLISIFGETENIAELGALGRIGMALAILFPFFDFLIYPRISKGTGSRDLYQQAAYGFSIILLFGSALFLLVFVFRDLILLILGDSYVHLGPELIWFTAVVVVEGISTLFFRVNASRGWIVPTQLLIPVRLSSLVAFVILLDVSSVVGVIQLQLCNHLVGIMLFSSYFIFRCSRMTDRSSEA